MVKVKKCLCYPRSWATKIKMAMDLEDIWMSKNTWFQKILLQSVYEQVENFVPVMKDKEKISIHFYLPESLYNTVMHHIKGSGITFNSWFLFYLDKNLQLFRS